MHPPWNKEQFKHALQRLMTTTGISRHEIADLAGVSPPSVSRWTTGANRPQFDALQRLARGVRVRHPDADDLITGLLSAAGYEGGVAADTPAPEAPPVPATPFPRPPDPDGYTRPAYGDPDLEAFARALEARPDMAPMLHRDIDQAVQVMAQRKRMLSAEARVAELERENAALRAELAQARPERQGALPAASIPDP